MNQSPEPETLRLFNKSKWLRWIAIAVIVMLALAVRFYDLDDLPLDFHSTRQMHSMLMARGMYYQTRSDIPEWQKTMSLEQWKLEGLIEPPIMEGLTALGYQLAGTDDLRIPRVMSIIFWMLGALPLYWLARGLIDHNGAVFALAFYLILPYGAQASRAFQPDPLMVSTILWAVWAAWHWSNQPGWKWAIISGLLAGLAVLVKSVAAFFVAGAWVGLLLSSWGIKKVLKNIPFYVAVVLAALPFAAFTFYGLKISGEMAGQFSLRFFPNLWIDPVWYLRWNGEISSVVGFEWFIASLAGVFLMRKPAGRWMMLGLFAGYVAFSFALPYHAMTHDYYQEPLIPVVAIGVGAVVSALITRLDGPRWLYSAAIIGLLVFWVGLKAWDTRVALKRNDYRGEPALWQKLGDRLGHDSHVLAITQDYGYRLEYWGWLTPTNWMNSGDFMVRELAGQEFDRAKLFKEQVEGKDYFLVTAFGEFDSQAEFKDMINSAFPVLEKTDDYIIYDLKHPLPAGSTAPAEAK
jgi:4-amino-4-deoxy-L-arabinose transferase-like glycosyltransferase